MPTDLHEFIALFDGSQAKELLTNEVSSKRHVESVLAPVFDEFEDLLFMEHLQRDLQEMNFEQRVSMNQLLCLAFSTYDTRGSKQFLNTVSFLFERGSLVYELHSMANRVFSGLQKDNLGLKLNGFLEDMVNILKEHGEGDQALRSLLINVMISLFDLIKRTADHEQAHVMDKFLIEWVVLNMTKEPILSGQALLINALSPAEKNIKVVYPTLLAS